jgi:hypothetical protein
MDVPRLRFAHLPTPVLGISVDESEEWLESEVSKLASATSENVGERIEFKPADVLVNFEWLRRWLWCCHRTGARSDPVVCKL